MAKKTYLYRISFIHQGAIYQVYAKHVGPSNLLGFIEIEELIFNAEQKVVVDPSEAKLKAEFEGVKRLFLPINTILRVEQVENGGPAKISELKGKAETSNIAIFPPSIFGRD